MADLNSTIVRGKLRVTEDINANGDLIASKITLRGDQGSILLGNGNKFAMGTNGQFLRTFNGHLEWVDNPNTWRPVIDNLTSTATDKSLSANQGKVLKDTIDSALSLTQGSNISISTTASAVTISADYKTATNSTAGIIKPWYSTTGSSKYNNGTTAPSAGTDSPNINARSTTAGRYYAVEMDANGRAYVNVPWTTHYLYRYDITVRGSSFNGNLDTVITFNMFSTTAYAPATWTYTNLVNRLSKQGYTSDTTICAANGIKISNYYAPQGSAHVLGVYANGSNLGFVYGETATNGNTLSINSASFGSYGIPDVFVVINGPFTV